MPFNYLACSIKGTAFSEYSSLLLITREMNSLSGGASVPNATRSRNAPSTTNHHQSPRPGPPPPAARRSLRLRAPREPPERSPGRESATRSSGSRPALAPSRARGCRPAGRLNCGLRRRQPPARPPSGRASQRASERDPARREPPPELPARGLASPDLEPHPSISELPPLAALSAPVFWPAVGVEEGGLEERESEFLKLLGGAGIELGGREPGGKGEDALPRFNDFCHFARWRGQAGVGPFKIHPPFPLPSPLVYPSLS